MQCGASAQGALACVTELAALPGWWGLPAVKSGCVFVVDHAPFLRPGPRVVRRSLHPCNLHLPTTLTCSEAVLWDSSSHESLSRQTS